MFTLGELTTYLPDAASDQPRADLVRGLALALVYEVLPEAYAVGSPRARAIGLEVAARAYRNVSGYSSETVDDYTYRRDTATRSPGVYLTSEERHALSALNPSGSPTARVRTVQLRSRSAPYVADTTLPTP